MNSRILAFAGHKQAGKTACSNFIHGYQLRAHGIINTFNITTDGKLVVDTVITNPEGEEERANAALDVSRNDEEFAAWAMYNMWPYVKNYSFAGPLKEIATTLFGLKPEQVYGTEIQKNTKTWFNWEDMPGVVTEKAVATKSGVKELIAGGQLKHHKSGRMTAREFLQFFGTDVCRNIFQDIWQERLINSIASEGPLVAIIDDCRFPNEVEGIQNAGGKVVHLTRSPHKDGHASETAIDGCKNFDAVIDNAKLSIHETNVEIIRLLGEWGWLGESVKPPELNPKPPEPEQSTHPLQSSDEPELVGGIHTIKKESE